VATNKVTGIHSVTETPRINKVKGKLTFGYFKLSISISVVTFWYPKVPLEGIRENPNEISPTYGRHLNSETQSF